MTKFFNLREKGAISMELLLSICFLIVMVFFSYQMLTRQKDTIIAANQEVEATGYLFKIKKILASQCTHNFKGLSVNERTNQIKFIKELVEYEDGSVDDMRHFSKEDSAIKGSKTGLKLSGYTLSKRSLKRKINPGLGYLIVRFSRAQKSRELVKQVPIYIEKAENGAISKCSLSPFARQLGLWLEKDNFLVSNESVGFGIEELSASINIHADGLYVEKGMSQCKGSLDSGAIFWDREDKDWKLCTNLGLERIEDKVEVELW